MSENDTATAPDQALHAAVTPLQEVSLFSDDAQIRQQLRITYLPYMADRTPTT